MTTPYSGRPCPRDFDAPPPGMSAEERLEAYVRDRATERLEAMVERELARAHRDRAMEVR